MFNNLFGKKKSTAPSTVSATSAVRPEDTQTTIVKLRDNISNQEKRYVRISGSSSANHKKCTDGRFGRIILGNDSRMMRLSDFCCSRFRSLSRSLSLYLSVGTEQFARAHREEHINRKIEQVVAEAKAKLAKGDKKGAFFLLLLCF
jgi:hypothetical protein